MEKHAFSDFLGIEITKIEKDTAQGFLTVNKNLLDHIGHVTGGVYNSLADAVGGALARSNGDLYVTQGCSMQYYNSTTMEDEKLFAKAILRHRGSRTCIVAIELYHKDGSIASDGQMTYSKIQ